MQKAVVIHNGSIHTEKIVNLLSGWDVTVLTHSDPAIHDIDASTLVVLSGGSRMALISHLEEYANVISFIRNFSGPMIGICLGFEMMAHVHGGWLVRRDKRTRGVMRIALTNEGKRLFGQDELTVYEAHRWHLENIDEPLIPLAWSDGGIEIIRHRTLPQFGVQFHPEVVMGTDGESIFNTMLKSISVI